ncbi:uncharacterized protein LOC124122014 isoform X2 [Haliotis rufescens]|uniref:uncharacterized protein LOC124122014 isoform X2 n=1 Tax=Haliotis rufescens TaxID=6454 RepID=UPI00201F4553|nr:uncharacterized protein LOC124122014 isoform X2 [Haliotis rufescens]
MAPSLMLVLLAIAIARAELNTADDVVQFVQSNCVSIGAVAQETCNNCERACRPSLELGEYCEEFCEGDRTDKCDVLGKFRPGDAARYNDTAEVHCGSNEFTDICRILRSLRDAALLLESGNPCVSAAASAEEDDTSKDKDVCSELLADSKDLVLCKPSDITNEKEEAPRGAAAADGHVPLSRDDHKGPGGLLRPRREATRDTTVKVQAPAGAFPNTDRSCDGQCKESCAGDETSTWHNCESGKSCCFPLEGHEELFESTDNDTSDAVGDRSLSIAMLSVFNTNRSCDGQCKKSCAEDETSTWHICESGESCCFPFEGHEELFEQDCKLQRGECKGECGHGEIEVWYTCVSGQACCFQMISTIFTERQPVIGQSGGTLTSDEAAPSQEIHMRDVFGADDRNICEPTGTCKGKCEDVMEVELSWYQCDATDETCCVVAGQ